jgi:hypothetical protein
MYSVRIRKTSRGGKNELRSYEYQKTNFDKKKLWNFFGNPQEAMNNKKILGAAPAATFCLFIVSGHMGSMADGIVVTILLVAYFHSRR